MLSQVYSNEGEAFQCASPTKGMKCYQLWKLGFSDMKGVTVPRTRASPRRRIWISVVVIFIIITVLWAYLYPPQDYSYPVRDWFPSEPTRELTDAETAARVVFRQILSTRSKEHQLSLSYIFHFMKSLLYWLVLFQYIRFNPKSELYYWICPYY